MFVTSFGPALAGRARTAPSHNSTACSTSYVAHTCPLASSRNQRSLERRARSHPWSSPRPTSRRGTSLVARSSAASDPGPLATCADASSKNPLERLRVTPLTERAARAALLQELDLTWSEWEEQYQPTPAEKCLAEELGVGQSTVMLAAVQNPGLSSLDAGSQVLPSVRALRSAGIGAQDSWFLVSKRWQLMAEPAVLSRWLDFLGVYGMQPRDCQNFLLRSQPSFLVATTLYQAGQVVTFLKGLGLKDDLLASRVLCVWPELLGCDVEGQLRPVVSYLMSLGLEVAGVGRVVVLWPEILLKDVQGQLAPWVAYLRGLGCTTSQVADVVCLCPHLLGFKPEEVFGGVLAALADVGIGPDDVRAMVTASLAFLITPSASAAVRAAVDCLQQQGFTREQIRSMALARPELLAVKPHDLSRSLRFVRESIGGDNATVMACPLLLAKPLGQVLGPRYNFIQKQGLAHKYTKGEGGSGSSTDGGNGRSSGNSTGGFEFYKLLVPEDNDWCASMGLSVNEYQGFKLVWDEEYSLQLHQEAASEFQQELKKLGIYEGS